MPWICKEEDIKKNIRQNSHTRRLHQQSHTMIQRPLRPSQCQRSQNVPMANTNNITGRSRRMGNLPSAGPFGHGILDVLADFCYELVEAV